MKERQITINNLVITDEFVKKMIEDAKKEIEENKKQKLEVICTVTPLEVKDDKKEK